ncbi:MAG: hypothetical protein ACKOYG_06590 [Ilumatobacteraceae bacterium]
MASDDTFTPASQPDSHDDRRESLSDDALGAESEAALEALREARDRLGDVPATVVVTNHVMGLYELAAIHLSAAPPRLGDAVLAIDAMACLVEGLGDRLGDESALMRDALSNIRLAFVQIKASAGD